MSRCVLKVVCLVVFTFIVTAMPYQVFAQQEQAGQQKAKIASIPKGAILPWYDKSNNPPYGWAFCDGTKGTPDLRGMYLFGAKTMKDVGTKVGEKEHSHQFSGTTGQETNGRNGPHEGGDNWTGSPNWEHQHGYSGTTKPGSNLPPSIAVRYIMRIID